MEKVKATCNQCSQEMITEVKVVNTVDHFVYLELTTLDKFYYDYGKNKLLMVCSNPKCPNYGLLQLPAERMPTDDEKKIVRIPTVRIGGT